MKQNNSHSSLIYFITPLIIYETAFVFFVIYYAQHNTIWFRIAYIATGASFIAAFTKTLACYKRWQNTFASKKSHTICLMAYFTSFTVYLLCLFILFEQWTIPASPSSVIFIFLSIPPVMEFIIFLAIEPY